MHWKTASSQRYEQAKAAVVRTFHSPPNVPRHSLSVLMLRGQCIRRMRRDHLSLKGSFGPGHSCYVTAFGPIAPPSLDNPRCVAGKLVASIQDAMLSRVVIRSPPPPLPFALWTMRT